MNILLFLLLLMAIISPFYLYVTFKQAQEKRRKEEWESSIKYTVLRIDVPRNNDKAPLAAEQMLASLHGIYSESSKSQYRLSFEIIAKDKYIQFYVYTPVQLRDFVEGQIYAQYPTVEISEVEDYTKSFNPENVNFADCELEMTKPDVYPIKLFSDFEVDPLSGITSVMSNLSNNEQVWLQVVIKPVGDEWQDKGNSIISAIRSGESVTASSLPEVIIRVITRFFKELMSQAIRPERGEVELWVEGKEGKEVKLPGTVEEALKGIEYKIMKLGYETKIRIQTLASDPITAKLKCQNIAATFKQYNTTNLNGFKINDVKINNKNAWREFADRELGENVSILNISEIASIFHLPHETVTTPSIVWSGSKKGEPPSNLPMNDNTPAEELTVLGETNFRNSFKLFGIKKDDRRRHIYIVGKSGTGKSTLIENMALDDMTEGRGLIVVDPHGELADKILACIPDERVNDVIVFDPADRAYPIAFNLLESVEDDFKGMVASGFVGIFKKIFGDSWGPRLEHILRNTVLALLDFPESTMLDIPKMLTDSRFRDRVVEKVKDPVIKDFWVNEFASYDARFRTEAVSPILNKVGQFLATSTIRNIVGQPHTKINIREIMDQQKIMIVNLSRGKIGEDNSALLGAMVITKIQLAAMSRADVTIDKRPDCYLYVDEFQNFATDSFAVILSEARKYNLCLTIANQYIEQMPEEVRSAVFGNAGSIISFRVGGTDAQFLVKEFEPVFEANDLVNLDKYQIYIKLLINGISSPAFSARTLPPADKITGNGEAVVNQSRKRNSTDRAIVEEQIVERSKQDEEEIRKEAELFKQGGLKALLTKKTPNSLNSPEVTNNKAEKLVPEKIEAPIREIENKAKTENYNVSENVTEKKKKDRKRIIRYQNIIGDRIYKEQTARGGVKWYIGEPVNLDQIKEDGIEVTENVLKMIDLVKRANKDTGSKAVKKETKADKIQDDEQVTNPGREKDKVAVLNEIKENEPSEIRYDSSQANQTAVTEAEAKSAAEIKEDEVIDL
jgi:hypothetical protein